MRIYLTGFMGSGKSTIGRQLALKLNFNFEDLDNRIENNYKTSIPLIFEKYDESAFRKLEADVLRKTAAFENMVIATGGGTPCFFDNMEWMNQHGLTIYIQLSPHALTERVFKAKKIRPLIRQKSKNEVLEFIQLKLPEREPFYQEADLIFEGQQIDLDKLAQEIVIHSKFVRDV